MELVLVEDLFPAELSIEERTRHWIRLFSLFNNHHEKALGYVLLQKQRYFTSMFFMVRLNYNVLHFSCIVCLCRLQNELRTYLGLRKRDKVCCLTSLPNSVVW